MGEKLPPAEVKKHAALVKAAKEGDLEARRKFDACWKVNEGAPPMAAVRCPLTKPPKSNRTELFRYPLTKRPKYLTCCRMELF